MSSPIDNYRNYLATNYPDMKLPAGKPYGVIKLAKGYDLGFHVRKDHISVNFISNGTHDPEEVMGYINDNGIGDKTYGDGLEPDVFRGTRNANVVRCEVHIPLESVDELRKPTLRKHSQRIFDELYNDFSGIAGVERPKQKEDTIETVEEVAETSESKEFKSVIIGNQEWMAENLNVGHFKNSDSIPEAKTDEEWDRAGQENKPVWCFYDNKPENGEKYGRLYNWYAVNDARCLAPEGWHIPNKEEYIELVDYLAGEESEDDIVENVGGKLKETGFENWIEEPDGDATNESGFSALPGGYRSTKYYRLFEKRNESSFKSIGESAIFDSANESDSDGGYDSKTWGIYLEAEDGTVFKSDGAKGVGRSVRCIKD